MIVNRKKTNKKHTKNKGERVNLKKIEADCTSLKKILDDMTQQSHFWVEPIRNKYMCSPNDVCV